jgi:hypothetical protein
MRNELNSENDIRSIVDNSISFLHSHYPDSQLPDEHRKELDEYLWAESLDKLKLDEQSSIGYTYKALGAGTWALREAIRLSPSPNSRTSPESNRPNTIPSEIFEWLITQITMEGGDADTNCAVAGPLIGTWFGYRSLPAHWEKELKHREWLLAKADAAGILLGLDLESSFETETEETRIEVLAIESNDRDKLEKLETGLSDNTVRGSLALARDVGYDWEADRDTLIDAGEGSMTKEEVDAMANTVMLNAFKRLGQTPPSLDSKPKWKGKGKGKKSSGDCVIC